MYKLTQDIYAVGVINPTVRVFDVIMRTEYGTTYNSYLIDDAKTVLIDAVHIKFHKESLQNVRKILADRPLDYLVCNHAEPDHTGSIIKLLEVYPDVTIVGSPAAIKNIGAISNCKFNSLTVKDGETLELGANTLKFISAPNLHWPDTMFTYVERQKVIFTCDFFGAHYAEAAVLDTELKYPDKYWSSLKGYFEAIFVPFKKFVRAGLDKINALDIEMVATSHGPVLTEFFGKVKELFAEWSRDISEPDSAAIIYVSAYCYTKYMAEQINTSLQELGIKTYLFDVIESDMDEILCAVEKSPLLFFGSPTINKDALKPVWDVISLMDPISNRGKTALTFGSYGWSGEACANLNARLNGIGIKTPLDSVKANFMPDENDYAVLRERVGSLVQATKK